MDTRRDLLTPTEMLVLIMMTEGHTARSGAEALGMKRHTYRTHTQNIHDALGTHTNAQCVARAYQRRILVVP
jgi:DNA-binding NarL/FixJ family response regulator